MAETTLKAQSIIEVENLLSDIEVQRKFSILESVQKDGLK